MCSSLIFNPAAAGADVGWGSCSTASAGSQHVPRWGWGDKKKPNPVAVLQDLEADKPTAGRGYCQRMYNERGIATSSSSLELDSERSSRPPVMPVYFHSWVGIAANCTKCLISHHPPAFPRALSAKCQPRLIWLRSRYSANKLLMQTSDAAFSEDRVHFAPN